MIPEFRTTTDALLPFDARREFDAHAKPKSITELEENEAAAI
jgi:hypothetical protein